MEERIVKPPFLKILFPYCVGLIGGTFLPIPLIFIWSGIALALLLILYYSFAKTVSFFYKLLPFSLFFLSLGAYQMRNFELSSQWNFPKTETIFYGTVTSEGVDRPKTIRYNVQIDRYCQDHDKLSVHDWGITLYASRQKIPARFHKGDKICFRTTLRDFENPQDHSFDRRAYYRYQQIFAYGFASDIVCTQPYRQNYIDRGIGRIRIYITGFISTVVSEPSHRSLLSALLLGDKSDIPPDLKTSFARTGTLHLLVVSGVHCAFLYTLFSFFLSFLPNRKRWSRWVREISLMLLIWLYVLLTGGSVPVVRAAVMLSIVITGRLLNRSVDSFNSLYLAAFLILLFAPYQWMTVGFQLSFLALFSILYGNIYWQKWSWYESSNKIVRYWISLVFVSLTAQIGVTPLLLYYFGYISSWFLLSNLVAVPIVTLLLYLSVIGIPLASFPFVFTPLSFLLEYLSDKLLQAVAFVSNMPMATLCHQRITFHSALLLWFLLHLFPLIWRRRYQFGWVVFYALLFLLYLLL